MIPAREACGVVLAGGRSTRMGGDKALLPVSGSGSRFLLTERVALLRSVGLGRVLVSIGPASALPSNGPDVVVDERENGGPLEGIMAAMAAEPDRHLVVLAVDMPHVDRLLLERLLDLAGPDAGAAPTVDDRWEPLCSVLPPGSAALARSLIDRGKASPSALLDALAEEGRVVRYRASASDALRLRSWNRPEDVRPLRSAR